MVEKTQVFFDTFMNNVSEEEEPSEIYMSKVSLEQKFHHTNVDFNNPWTFAQKFVNMNIVLIPRQSNFFLQTPRLENVSKGIYNGKTSYFYTYIIFCAILTACKVAKVKRIICFSQAYASYTTFQFIVQIRNVLLAPFVAIENKILFLIENQFIKWTILFFPFMILDIKRDCCDGFYYCDGN